MNSLFLDSSALAKRYLPEVGSNWIREQIIHAPSVVVSRLTYVEVMSAVARRHREQAISQQTLQQIQQLLVRHLRQDYMVVEATPPIIEDAVHLLSRYPLRAYDAVQLATARQVHRRLQSEPVSPLLFLCADQRLIDIAQAEGLATDNPNQHP